MLRINFTLDDKLSAALDKLTRDASMAAVLAGVRNETLCLFDDALVHDRDNATDIARARARMTALALDAAYLVVRVHALPSLSSTSTCAARGSVVTTTTVSMPPVQLVLVVYVSDAAKPRDRMVYSAGMARLRDVLLDRVEGDACGAVAGAGGGATASRRSSATSSTASNGRASPSATTAVRVVQCSSISSITAELLQLLPSSQQTRDRVRADREALMTESERAEAQLQCMELAPQPMVLPGVPVQFGADVHAALEAYACGKLDSVVFRLDGKVGELVVDARVPAPPPPPSSSSNKSNSNKSNSSSLVDDDDDVERRAAAAWAALRAAVPRDHARFVVTHYILQQQRYATPLRVTALVCPASCTPRERMAYAAANAAFRQYMEKMHLHFARRIDVSDCDEIVNELHDIYGD